MDDAFEEITDEQARKWDDDIEVEKAVARLRIQDEAKRRHSAEQSAHTFFTLPRATLADALMAERDPVPHRIQHLHRIGHNSTITGRYKTGKTTLGENILRSLVDGVDFLDRFAVVKPDGRVGLLNYELDENDMLDWLAKIGIKRKGQIALLNLRGHRFSLAHDRNQEELAKWCRDMDVEVLHLDPHRRAFAGFGSENNNDDVNRFTDTLDLIKEDAGVRDLFLYVHMGRVVRDEGEEHARGATALDDWVDQRWIITRKQDTRFMYAEGRAGAVGEFALQIDLVTGRLVAVDGDRASLGPDTTRLDRLAGKVAHVARENPGKDTGWVLREAEVTTKGEQGKVIRRAEELDLIFRRKRGTSSLVYPVGDPP